MHYRKVNYKHHSARSLAHRLSLAPPRYGTSHQCILVTPWYPCILLCYGSVSHLCHALPPLSSLRGIALHNNTLWGPQP